MAAGGESAPDADIQTIPLGRTTVSIINVGDVESSLKEEMTRLGLTPKPVERP